MDNETAHTIQQAVQQAFVLLEPVSLTARQDATLLIAHLLGKPRSWVVAHPEVELPARTLSILERAYEQLKACVPLPYILGHWEFFGMDFLVDESVLIPRPETELLVERALEWLHAHPQHRLAADIGTGSGCIAISLAARIPDLHVYACDLSAGAVGIAQRNVQRHALEERVITIQSDLFDHLPSPVDLVCANLPYIPTEDYLALPVSRHEPRQALEGGADGLLYIRGLLSTASEWIHPNGLILLEIEARQGETACTLAAEAFPRGDIQVTRDLSGLERLLSIDLGSKHA